MDARWTAVTAGTRAGHLDRLLGGQAGLVAVVRAERDLAAGRAGRLVEPELPASSSALDFTHLPLRFVRQVFLTVVLVIPGAVTLSSATLIRRPDPVGRTIL